MAPENIESIESKIQKVIPLISEYYDEGSFVNEKSLVKQISKLLKPNQWLRIEPTPREYNTTLKYKQPTKGLKPNGIWASKGEWLMSKDKYLTLLEVDYSRILVLITKQDYLDFEKKYCEYEKLSSIINTYHPKTKKTNKNTKHTRKNNSNNIKNSKKLSKRERTTSQPLLCHTRINWQKVANDYDGIAMIPNPTPYFPTDWNNFITRYNHLWLKTYDVSSLVIWRQNDNTPITKYKSLGKVQDIYNQASKNKKTFSKTLLETIVNAQAKLFLI